MSSSSGKFEMHLIVPTRLVGAIVELMDGEGVVVTMSPHVETKRTNSKSHYANGKKDKGISGPDAVREVMTQAGRPMLAKEVGRLLASKHGFAVGTASPVLSKFLAEGKVVRDDAGKYSLKG